MCFTFAPPNANKHSAIQCTSRETIQRIVEGDLNEDILNRGLQNVEESKLWRLSVRRLVLLIQVLDLLQSGGHSPRRELPVYISFCVAM